jgi:hypothetical protein
MELDGFPLMIDIIESRDQLRLVYETLFPKLSDELPQLFSEEVYTYESFLWARAIFDSRGFSLDFEGKGLKNCLLPFIDMLNTSHYPNLDGRLTLASTTETADHEKEFQLRAFSEVEAGKQLFINYGPYSNRELLMNYGFVLDKDPYDRYRIFLEIPEDDLMEEKMEVLERVGVSQDNFLRKGSLSPKLLAALRICVMNEQEIKDSKTDESFNPIEHSISPRNEEEMFTLFLNLLESLIEDTAALSQEEGNHDESGDGEEEEVEDMDQDDQVEDQRSILAKKYCHQQNEILSFNRNQILKLRNDFLRAAESSSLAKRQKV